MNTIEAHEFWRKAARSYMEKNRSFLRMNTMSEEEFNHICHLAGSLLIARDFNHQAGGFVSAILDNDLTNAVSRADEVAIKGLKAFVIIMRNCFPAHEYNQQTTDHANQS
jgi:hypothetical protein